MDLANKNLVAGTSHTLTRAKIVDDASNTIQISTDSYNRLITGDAVAYSDGGGTAVDGLTTSTTYYVIKMPSPTIKLATTYANSIAAPPVPITLTTPQSNAAGTSHTFTKTSTPIYARLTNPNTR